MKVSCGTVNGIIHHNLPAVRETSHHFGGKVNLMFINVFRLQRFTFLRIGKDMKIFNTLIHRFLLTNNCKIGALSRKRTKMSHISDMLDHSRPSITTLHSACVVLIALRACRLSEALGPRFSLVFRVFKEQQNMIRPQSISVFAGGANPIGR